MKLALVFLPVNQLVIKELFYPLVQNHLMYYTLSCEKILQTYIEIIYLNFLLFI